MSPLNVSGVVEELFIAPRVDEPNIGVVDVWFRNYSVCAPLGIRSLLNADPESVVWAEDTKDAFCVRTGTNPATQQYYTFTIPRDPVFMFPPGAVPAPTQVGLAVTPGSSSLVLGTIVRDFELSQAEQAVAYLTAGAFQANTCNVLGATGSVAQQLNTNYSKVGTSTQSLTLANVLTAATVLAVRYGLDTFRELVLFIVAKLPAAFSTNSFAGSETIDGATSTANCAGFTPTSNTSNTTVSVKVVEEYHLFIVAYPTPVLVFSTLSGQSLLDDERTAVGVAAVNTGRTHVTENLPTCFEVDVCALFTPGVGAAAVPATVPDQFVAPYYAQLRQAIMDTALPFVVAPTEFEFDTANTAKNTSVGGSGPLAGGDPGTDYRRVYTEFTQSVGVKPWRYSILQVAPIRVTQSQYWLVSVKRRKQTSPGNTTVFEATEYGIYMLRTSGAEVVTSAVVRAYGTTGPLVILTANRTGCVWGREDNGEVSLTTYGPPVRTQLLGTTLAAVRSRRYRLVELNYLFRSGPEPSGQFHEFMEADGTPVLAEPPLLFQPFVDYDDLQLLPVGVDPPVLPSE